MEAAYDAISQWPGYAATPLHRLSAAGCGAGSLYYKDEAARFGLESFKALGGAYAVECLLARHIAGGGTAEQFTAATATDGNHGRSVAWGAQRAGCRAKIFVHRAVSDERVSAIAQYGADIVRVDGNYDDSVHACSEQAQRHGWHIISDTSWPGYTDTPRLVMAGYTVLMRETLQQLAGATPTHIVLQAGVGAFAAAMIAAWLPAAAALPRIAVVESEHADCLLQSAAAGRIVNTPIAQETVMAGLSCGEPSLLAWQILSAAASDFIAISDTPIAAAMRRLADGGIVAGECAAAGLALLSDRAARAALDIGEHSTVLMFGSEGATDRDSYRRLLGSA